MTKVVSWLLISHLSIVASHAQNQTYGIESTVEQIRKMENRKGTVIGSSSQGLFFASRNNKVYTLFLYDEFKGTAREVFENFASPRSYFSLLEVSDEKLLYSQFYTNSPDDGYQKLYLYDGKSTYYLDSVYGMDKDIAGSFSKDSKIVLVNTFSRLPYDYDIIKDNHTYIFYLDNLESGVKKDSVYCKQCSNSTLIDDKLFYTISTEKDEMGNYTIQEVYVAPWGNITDTTRIASHTELLAISSDGKYILGRRLDLFNSVCVIINVETKKYQILIGRDYQRRPAFYSEVERKFGFLFDNEIVYVDFPRTYPFDALLKDNPLVPIAKSSDIRKIFEK